MPYGIIFHLFIHNIIANSGRHILLIILLVLGDVVSKRPIFMVGDVPFYIMITKECVIKLERNFLDIFGANPFIPDVISQNFN